MKILLINAVYGQGSTGVIVQDIQSHCISAGMDCLVMYSKTNQPKASIRGVKIGNLITNKLHAGLTRINGKQGYFSFLSTINLIRKIDKIKPDIINIHNLHNNYVNLNMLLRAVAKRRFPLVVTLHDCWYFTGGCTHFTKVNCSKWLTDCNGCPKKKEEFPAYFKDGASEILKDRYKYFSKINRLYLVGVSEWITSLAKKTVFKNANCRTIHNGVDTTIFKPRTSALKAKMGLEGKYIILGPASKWLDPVNRDLLLSVSNNLDDHRTLLLFGCKDNIKIDLPHVKTFGFTENKIQLAELYSMGDVFVNCSREDTLSTINLEAQACGTPLITYDNTGSKETANQEFSISVKTGDVKGIMDAIKKIPPKSKEVSKALSLWICNNFNKDINYDKYVELFKEIKDDK